MRWMATTALIGTAVTVATGCNSMADRVEKAVQREVENCQRATDDFYTFETRQGSTHEVLAEACHLEPSDAEMQNDWKGSVQTGPVVWTAAENDETGTVNVVGAGWPELDRAREHAGSDEVESLETAEEHFATAQEQFPESSWVRLNRLENLLDLRAAQRSEDVEENLIGDRAKGVFEETVEWAESGEKPAVAARARLLVLEHLDAYIEGQDQSRTGFGAQDERLESAIEHAEENDNTEEAEEYRQELEERRERRPELIEEIEERIRVARAEGCQYTGALDPEAVENNDLQNRIESTVEVFECSELDANGDE